jgi:hypothetical protein
MAAMRRIVLITLLLAGCGDPIPGKDFNNVQAEAAPSDADAIEPTPVRIGEFGPSFKACATDGTTRNVAGAETLPVRSAPFEAGAQTGAIPAGARFYVCSRTLDQKWLGIVYDESGLLAPRCGVSDPATARRAYEGPCRSGWVSSAFVKLIAGIDQVPNQPAAPSSGEAQKP